MKTLLEAQFAREETMVEPFAPLCFTAAQFEEVGEAFDSIEREDLKERPIAPKPTRS
jgi:hypothetical protein